MSEYDSCGVKKIDNFYVVCQPIVKVQSMQSIETIVDYEVLLRSKRDDKFPLDDFREIVENEVYNETFLKWFKQEIQNLLHIFPNYKFDINIDPQQFRYQKTWEFINSFYEERSRIIIEVTESIPLDEDFMTQSKFFNNSPLFELKRMGFKTALDDVDTGQNSLQLVSKNIDNIDRLKISLIAFKGLREEITYQFLEAWFRLAKKYDFEFVVEGIDNENTVRRLIDSELFIQQGFFWQKPNILK